MGFDILDIIKIAIRWIFDRKVRLQLAGYRPEVICLIRDNTFPGLFLIAKPSIEPNVWIPPHEGIFINESVEEAAVRCLKVELGLEESSIQYRKSIWLGKRVLPALRWDERDLPFSLRGLVSKHRMIGKAYYGALINTTSSVTISKNPSEIIACEWVNKDEFNKKIQSNSVEKIDILEKLLQELTN